MAPIPSLVVRRHDPAHERRRRLLFAATWLGSLLIAVALVSRYVRRTPDAAQLRRLAEAEQEIGSLKSQIAVLSRSEQVARGALLELQQTLREREEEVDGLRADLAFYGRLVGGGMRVGLAVHTLRITPVQGTRAWNFTATLTQNFKRGQDIQGRLRLRLEGVRDGRLEQLDWPTLAQGREDAGIEYRFKYFQQVSGTIMLPAGFLPNRVIVNADGGGDRVEQAFSWAEAIKGEEVSDVPQ
jgi:hypothetical protein